MTGRRKMTLGRLILETARGDIKERVITGEDARDIHEQLTRIGLEVREKVRAEYYRGGCAP
jgi:hypothetical protein